MRKLLVCSAIVSCFMLNSFSHAQSYSSIHTLGKLPIVKVKGTGTLDLTSLIASNPRLVFAVKNPKSGEISYTRNTLFYGKSDGYYYQGQNRLQGYPISSDIASSDCKLTDIKSPPEEIPALATTTVNYNGNLQAGAAPPSHPVFNPTDAASFNFTNMGMIYDSLGVRHELSVYYIKDSEANAWTTNIYVDHNSIGTGKLVFSVTGILVSATGMSALKFTPYGGAAPQEISLQFSGFSQFGSSYWANPTESDGMPAGIYAAYSLDSNGYITFNYSNMQSITFGKVAVFHV
ncbi:MAG: flagellar basal body FlgE domain-containing protein [Gammaproteobacteria bacterium]